MHFQDSLLCKWKQGEKRNCPYHGTCDNQRNYRTVQLQAERDHGYLGCNGNRATGFTAEQIELLLTGTPLKFSGSHYSDEYRKKFNVDNAEIKVFSTSAKPNILILAVNRQPITEWFKEQWDNLKSRIYTMGRKFGI